VIDHLVYATPDLEGTVAAIAASTGVTASPGGRHLGRGSRNFLADLGDGAYLEIIGHDPEQPLPSAPLPFGLDEVTHATLVGWALRVDDIDEAVASARAAGWDPGDAVAMSRERPDGVVLRWRLTPWEPPYPFLIDWGTSPHPSRSAVPGLRLVELSVPDIPAGVPVDFRVKRTGHLAARVEGPAGVLSL
jgi:hypothetical protein